MHHSEATIFPTCQPCEYMATLHQCLHVLTMCKLHCPPTVNQSPYLTSEEGKTPHNAPWCCTLSERVDGVTGRQVGAGDKVLAVGRLNLHPRPALQVAMETANLTSGESDVGHAALAVVPWGKTAERMTYKLKHMQITAALGQMNAAIHWYMDACTHSHYRSVPAPHTQTSAQSKCQLWFICVIIQLWNLRQRLGRYWWIIQTDVFLCAPAICMILTVWSKCCRVILQLISLFKKDSTEGRSPAFLRWCSTYHQMALTFHTANTNPVSH